MEAEGLLLKAPYDGLRALVVERTSLVSREINAAHYALSRDIGVNTDVLDGSPVSGFVATLLEVEQNLVRLRDNLEDNIFPREVTLLETLNARVTHLSLIPIGDDTDGLVNEQQLGWDTARLHRMIVDHTARSGDLALARQTASETVVENLCDLDAHVSGIEASAGLRYPAPEYDPAIKWCEALIVSLNRVCTSKWNGKGGTSSVLLLEYRLHFAKCLDILFADEKRKAVEYAREHIVPRMKILDPQIRGFTDDTCDDDLTTSYKSDLQLLLKSLAVSGNGLFDAKKWFTNADRAALASFFDNVRAQQAGLPNESRLVASLRAGLTSLKTGAHVSMESELVSKQSEPEKGTRDDPLSSPALRALAVSLPLTKRARTRLTCRVTGAKMDENNPPVVLPNGYVYSQKGVDFLLRRGQVVYCPRTGDGPFEKKNSQKPS